VFLRLQPYRQMSVAWRRNLKLSPKFYEPFLIVKKVGTVAYQLDLPAGSQIHPVFHVSQVKLKLGRTVLPISHLPAISQHGVIQPEPEEVLEKRSRKVHNKALLELLIHWQGQLLEEATWETFQHINLPAPCGQVF
jgi:hypothetical protein